MSSGGLASVFVGGLLKTARLHVCQGCRELAAAPTAFLGFGSRPEQQLLPAEPWWARGIQVVRVLAAAGRFLVISTMREHCDFHRQGSRSSLCSVPEEHSMDFGLFVVV
jgi:hypothetical protein